MLQFSETIGFPPVSLNHSSLSRTGASVTADGGAPAPFGDEKADHGHGQEQGQLCRGRQLVGQHADGEVGDQQHGDGEGEQGLEETARKGVVGYPRDVKEVVVTPNDALGADGPEADGGQQEHQGVVNQYARHAQDEEAEHLDRGGHERDLAGGVGHDCHGKAGINKGAEVHLPEGNDEAGVDREQEQKVQFAGANEFGKIGAVDEEEGLEKLLDEVAPANEHDDLPFGPGADVFGVQVKHTDKAELESEPKKLDDDPEEEFPAARRSGPKRRRR